MGTFRIRRYRHIVYAIYTQNGKTFKVSTGIKVDDQHWNFDKLVRSTPAYEAKNQTIQSVLSELMGTVNKMRYSGIQITVNNVRKEFGKIRGLTEKPLTFWQQRDRYLDYKKPRVAFNTYRNMRMMFRSLCEYQTEYNYEMDPMTFTLAEFERYVMFLSLKCQLRDNSVCKHVRMLKAFLHWAYPEERFSYVTHKTVDPDIVYLSESEIHHLMDAELGDHFHKVRDLFVFLCLTGMRYSDSQRVDISWLENGVFRFRQLKTGGIAMPPIFDAVKRILARWGGAPPHMAGQSFNRSLKNLFKHLNLNRPIQLSQSHNGQRKYNVIPLSDAVSSQVGRKTFITTCLNKGIPIQDVMRMSGHSDFRSIRRYIEITAEHIKEVARKWEI
jgi:site-specific recombinase XerD